MLAGLFRSNQPAVQLAVPLLVLGLLLPLRGEPAELSPLLMPLAAAVNDLIGPHGWLRHTVGLVLVLVLAIQLAALVNRVELMERRNHLPALLFPLWLAGLGGDLYDPALLGMPFALLALRRTWSVSNTGPALSIVFDGGLLIALAALFYLPYAFLVVALWASVSLIRPFAWREYITPLLAMALVVYIAWAGLLLAGTSPWRPLLTVAAPQGQPPSANGNAQIAFVVLGAIVVLVALAAFASGYARSVMRGKNMRSSFLAFAMALGVLVVLLWLLNGRFPSVLAAVPLSVISAYALLAPRKKWLAEAAAWGLVALACWVRWTG